MTPLGALDESATVFAAVTNSSTVVDNLLKIGAPRLCGIEAFGAITIVADFISRNGEMAMAAAQCFFALREEFEVGVSANCH